MIGLGNSRFEVCTSRLKALVSNLFASRCSYELQSCFHCRVRVELEPLMLVLKKVLKLSGELWAVPLSTGAESGWESGSSEDAIATTLELYWWTSWQVR